MNGIGGRSRIRISGINSNLDTEKLVSDMLAVSQSRVDRQYQSRQSLIWKQEAYRTSITGINSLKNKWFSSSNPATNLGSAAFFATYKANTESKLFSVKATSNASNAGFTIDSIKQLASYNKIKGQQHTSADLKGKLEADDTKLEAIFDKTNIYTGKKGVDFDIVLDGTKKTINVQGATKDEIASNLQAALDTAFGKDSKGDSRVKAIYDNTDPANSTIELSSGNSKLMIGSTNSAALNALGFKNGQSTKVRLGDKLSDVTFNAPLIGGKYEFTINDVKFSFTDDSTLSEVMTAVNNSKAGVTMAYDEISDSFSLTSKLSGSGSNVRVSQEAGNLLSSMLGTKQGNGIGTIGSLYGDLVSGTALDKTAIDGAKNQGFQVTINGVSKIVYIPGQNADGTAIDYTALDDEKVLELIQNQINGEFAEGELVKLTKDADGKISFAVRDGGTISLAANPLTNDTIALDALGFAGNAKKTNIVSADYTYGNVVGKNVLDKTAVQNAALAGSSIEITVDGVTRSVSLPTVDSDGNPLDYSTMSSRDITVALNKSLDAAFAGSGVSTTNVQFGIDGNDKINFFASGGTEVSLTAISGDTALFNALGFDAGDRLTNVVAKGGTMGDLDLPTGKLTINGKDFVINPNQTIQDFMKDINKEFGDGSVTYKDGGFTFRNVDSITGDSAVMQKMFGVDSYNPSGSTDNYKEIVAGQNAVVTINGTEIERGSNTFLYDGVEVTLNGVSEFNADGTVKEPAGKVNITTSVDDAVTKIKEFVKDYNALIDLLSSQTSTKPNADYAPLTDAQKKSMTEQQIKDWEKVAKQGVLYNDPEINKLLGNMRSSLYASSSTGMALYEMGITTGDYKNGGKLEFAAADASGVTGEDKLRKALTDRPDSVANLFANPTDGIAARMTQTLDAAASTSPTKKGSLVNIAGVEKHSSEKNNTIEKSIKDIDALIIKYKKQLADEEDRYWAQFTAMEKALSSLNSQSNYLMQQLGLGS